MIKLITYSFLLVPLLFSCETATKKNNKTLRPTNKVILSSNIIWEKLNPARGDQSPQAGTIWGDRKGTEATGFLAKFVDGFSSPPHIHNVTYRAVVIKGLIHNDDPEANNMWMPTGSFWTQPFGEAHITSAKGKENIALVEIDKGPYLVKPISEAFDNGERPINIDASNIVWLSKQRTNWIGNKSNAKISFLWEDGNNIGLFIKVPHESHGVLNSDGSVFHAVVVQGVLQYEMPNNTSIYSLDAGSYFGATNNTIHTIYNNANQDVILYIRTNGEIRIN
ncbi:MAG: DUF4437 domain-containing protein [Flavicella sp.]|nr:DUF4437 domain-containing protein [Flavicella sp.]